MFMYNHTFSNRILMSVKKVLDVISFGTLFPLRFKNNATDVKKTQKHVSLFPGIFPKSFRKLTCFRNDLKKIEGATGGWEYNMGVTHEKG